MPLHCHHQGQAPSYDNGDDDDGDKKSYSNDINADDGSAYHEVWSEVGHAGRGPLLLLYHGLLHLRELSPGHVFFFNFLFDSKSGHRQIYVSCFHRPNDHKLFCSFLLVNRIFSLGLFSTFCFTKND